MAGANLISQLIQNAVNPVTAANTPQIQDLQNRGYIQGAGRDVGIPQPTDASNPLAAIAQTAGTDRYIHDSTAYRTPLSAAGDTLNSFLTGLFTTPAEMANIPVQAISDRAGSAVTHFIDDGIKNADAKKSDALHDQERAYQARNGLTADYHRAQESEDVANGDSPLTAGLKRIGRDFISSITDSNSMLLGDQVANAAGAIATVGPMEKGLAIAGRTALKGGMETGAIGFGGARTALRFGSKAGMPAVIGAQQAAGIDQSTASSILNMSPEELAANSQSYRDAINSGMSDEQAREHVANEAGLTAGAISFPLAAVAGELRVPFARAPFSPGSVGEAASNILKSGADGAVFGVDGALAGNKATQMFANNNQDMEEGVGQAAGQGAVMGLGMAAATQAPGALARVPFDIANKAYNGLKTGLANRGANKLAEVDAQSPVSAANMDAQQAGAIQAINTPEVNSHFEDAVAKASPEDADYINQILGRAKLAPEDLQHPIPAVQDALQGATNRFDAIRQVANLASNKEAPDADRVSAGQYLLSEFRKNANLLESPSRTLESLPEDHPAVPHLRTLEDIVANAVNHPDVQKAISQAHEFNVTANSVDPNTPEGQQALHNAIRIAEHSPERVDPETNQKVLDLADKGKVDISSEQKSALEASRDIAKANNARTELAKKLGLTKESISKEITLDVDPDSKDKPHSAREHGRAIMSAMFNDNPDLAKQRMQRFSRFAKAMQNKVDALNEHFTTAEGKKSLKMPYQTVNETTGKFFEAEKRHWLSVDPKEEGSVKFANRVNLDAQFVHDQYNAIADAYPKLGFKPREYTPLHPELTSGSPEEIVKKFRQLAVDGKPQYEASEKPAEKADVAPEAEASTSNKGTAQGSQESANKGEDGSSSKQKAPVEEKVPDEEPKVPQTRREHSQQRSAELGTAKPGEMKVAEAFPAELRDQSEEGLKHFAYRTEDGKQLIRGKYHVTGDTIENLDVGDTNNKTTLGAGETRNLYKQIVAENPEVKWIHGYRITGGRVSSEHVWFEVTDKGLKFRGQDDPRGADETSLPVSPAKAETATEETTSGSDQEVAATPEVHSIGSQPDGYSSGITKRYPGLFSNVAKGVTNWFAKGFTTPKEDRSRLATADDPIERIRDAIESPKAAEDFTGAKLGRKLLPIVSDSFEKLIVQSGDAYNEMKSRLENILQKKMSDGQTVEEALLNGRGDKNAVNTLREFKVLNLVEQAEDGKIGYNEHILKSALLGGLHWLVSSAQSGRIYDQEGLAELLGIDPAEAVNYLGWFNGGHYTSDGVESLRQTIERFWGVSQDRDTPLGLNQGVSEAMAKEMILGLQKAGLLQEHDNKLTVAETGKTYSRLVATLPEDIREGIKSFPDLLDHLASVEPEQTDHLGSPPEKVDGFQMGGDKLVKISRQQRQTIENNQAIAHNLERNTSGFMLAMDKPLFTKMFGFDLHDDMNINDRKAKESYNRTIEAAYDYIDGLRSQLQAVADETGQDVHDVPIHYEYKVSRVNRLHAQGRQNPQSNKFVRMAVLPTKVEFEPTDAAHRNMFLLAAAQHLGLKIERLGVDNAVEQMASDVRSKYAESFKTLHDWAAGDQKNPPKLTEAQVATFDKEFGEKLTPEAFHALLDLARFAAHPKDEKFQTSLYIEADGKTDGPINSMMHLVTGGFTSQWLEGMAKGGLFVGDGPKTIAEYVNSGLGTDSAADLYGVSSNDLAHTQRVKLNTAENPQVKEQRIHMLNAMDALFGDDFNFDLANNKLEIDRGVTKNPMTVTVYGSGLDGIAAKIVDELTRRFYEGASKGTVSTRTIGALDALTKTVAILPHGKDSFVKQTDLQKINPIKADKNFTFTREQLTNIRENVKSLFVQDMNDSIERTLSDTTDGRESLRDTVQAQSIILEAAVHQAWSDAIKAKREADPNWNANIGLSQNEMDTIRKDQVAKYHALIESPTQTIFPAGSSNSDLSDGQSSVELSAGLNGELRTTQRVDAPGNAGVRGLPYSIISTDGQMIQNSFTGANRVEHALPVFDGINLRLDRASDDNRNINEAVLKGWMSADPLGNAARSYNKFLETVQKEGLPKLSPKQLSDMNRLLRLDKGSNNEKAILDGLAQHGKLLEDRARENRAMKNVLEKVNLAVDHMAGTESPHIQDGKQVVSSDFQTAAGELNRLYSDELRQISPEKEELSDEIKNLGQYDDDTRTMRVTPEDLRNAKLKLRPELQEVFDHILSTFKRDIIIGKAEDIIAQARDIAGELVNTLKPDVHGFWDPTSGHVFIQDVTGETLVHELIHAATRIKAYDYFHNPELLTDNERFAFERIEKMRAEWSAINKSTLSTDELKQFEHLDGVMKTADQTGDPSAAMNEFMAYALTNQHLINVGSRTTVRSKFISIMEGTYKLLKRVLFGDTKVSRPDKDIYSNLKFNTQVLIANHQDAAISRRLIGISMHQSDQFGRDDRLTDIRKGMARHLAGLINRASSKFDKRQAQQDTVDALKKADVIAQTISSKAFPMSPQELSTFKMMTAAFMTEAKLNPNTLVRLQRIYSHVMENLTVENFMKNPDGNDMFDRHQAQQKMEALSGDIINTTDRQGRSSLLPIFLALANVNEPFRDILKNIEVPKGERSDGFSKLDQVAENIGTDLMDNLEKLSSGDNLKDTNVQDSIDALTHTLAGQSEDDRNFITNFATVTGNAFDKGNAWVVNAMDTGANKGIDALENLKTKTNNKYAKIGLNVGQHLLSLASEKRSAELQEGFQEMINRNNIFKPLADVLNEFIGRTMSNGKVIDMIKLAKTVVSQIRQKFRDHLPKIIGNEFSRKIVADEWNHMHKAMIKTDIASLVDRFNRDELTDILKDPSKAAGEAKKLEEEIRSAQPENADTLLKKSQQLARWMNTGKVEHNFLRNATAIAHMLGERRERYAEPTDEMIKKIDHLTSLYALNGLAEDTKVAFSELAQKETQGVHFSFDYLVGQRKDEMAKVNLSDAARLNHYKGYVPVENEDGASMVVADDREYTKLYQLGYTRVADYEGSQAEVGPKRGYYHAPASGKSPFLEGIMQNVRGSAYGVDTRTGHSYGPMTAGRITDAEDVRRLHMARMLNRDAHEPLMPIYDAAGHVTAYERSVDPVQEAKIKQVARLDKIIGQWRGRQAEEAASIEVNRKLVDALGDMWDHGITQEPSSYVNIFDAREQKRDPIVADAARLITPEAREMINQRFSNGTFYIRRDLLNNAIGYRQASVGDMWTGNTRISPEVADGAVKVLTGVFGVNAYKRLRWAESHLQDQVREFKTTIIVRSVIVPLSNMVADVYQLSSRGVPIKSIISGYLKKASEIDSYIKSMEKLNKIEADLRANEDKPAVVRSLRAKQQALLDTQKSMSIYPLIKSGQYSVISDMGMGSNDSWETMKSWDAVQERFLHRIPEPLSTIGRYGVVARDTALFKAMEKATEYGDFLGRAVLYDDLVNRQKVSHEDALVRVAQDFINYDYLPGRTRSYLESIGMTWFWNYKIRAAKVALSILRNNPVHMMFSMLAPHPKMLGTIGTPLRDNFISMLETGRLGGSIGPMMGVHSGYLNPWGNLMGIYVPDI